ncbi:hypothetical protein O181_045910 [Austropuccinia psidii MF-1]|uniref:Uncharacterized protein n=1 Tax=Austropuccinia psidii MF-1 TaxID=1389203 RepID=A0A9Q3DSA9_9BASI|nr:hypothetical protein [Austropuccinia psidii MF-1]
MKMVVLGKDKLMSDTAGGEGLTLSKKGELLDIPGDVSLSWQAGIGQSKQRQVDTSPGDCPELPMQMMLAKFRNPPSMTTTSPNQSDDYQDLPLLASN